MRGSARTTLPESRKGQTLRCVTPQNSLALTSWCRRPLPNPRPVLLCKRRKASERGGGKRTPPLHSMRIQSENQTWGADRAAYCQLARRTRPGGMGSSTQKGMRTLGEGGHAQRERCGLANKAQGRPSTRRKTMQSLQESKGTRQTSQHTGQPRHIGGTHWHETNTNIQRQGGGGRQPNVNHLETGETQAPHTRNTHSLWPRSAPATLQRHPQVQLETQRPRVRNTCNVPQVGRTTQMEQQGKCVRGCQKNDCTNHARRTEFDMNAT